MSFKGKPVTVKVTGDAKEAYEQLDNLTKQERTKGISGSHNQTLFNSINKKIELLKQNPQHGVHIPKNRIPGDYILRYEVNNLWKINLAGAFRMVYTIRGSEVEIISLILDILNHRSYEKKFKYKKS